MKTMNIARGLGLLLSVLTFASLAAAPAECSLLTRAERQSYMRSLDGINNGELVYVRGSVTNNGRFVIHGLNGQPVTTGKLVSRQAYTKLIWSLVKSGKIQYLKAQQLLARTNGNTAAVKQKLENMINVDSRSRAVDAVSRQAQRAGSRGVSSIQDKQTERIAGLWRRTTDGLQARFSEDGSGTLVVVPAHQRHLFKAGERIWNLRRTTSRNFEGRGLNKYDSGRQEWISLYFTISGNSMKDNYNSWVRLSN